MVKTDIREFTGWSLIGLHVMPNCDTREHNESEDCWCEPVDDEGVIVHNSADGRELFESGNRKPS